MRKGLRSIYSQLLLSFLLVIFFTITVSTLIEYRTYSGGLPELITETRSRAIAQHLSAAYTRDGGWDNAGAEMQRLINLDNLNTVDRTGVRVIVRDTDGRTIYNSFSLITRIESSELIEGESEPVTDYRTGETAGMVTLYINRSYINELSRTYVSKLLFSALLKILITGSAAVLFGIGLSRHISRPVVKLTESAAAIEEGRIVAKIESSSSNEIGRLAGAFNSMANALELQKDLRKRLIADVAHEITNPLNAIRLEARALSDGLAGAQEAGGVIISEVDALRNLVYDLDWLAETDSGRYSLNREEYSVGRLLRDETLRWKHKAESLNVELRTEACAEEIPPVPLDIVRISTVLGNLIDNALKHADGCSRITVSCKSDSSCVYITVADDGMPIDEAHRGRIFERFYRIPDAAEPSQSGRGLGLSIVEQIVRLHGGQIKLECGSERGNSFTFTLPIE